MIVFDLKCDPEGHVFEAWFGSTADYEEQSRRGLVACPLCGSEEVDKAVMAPRVGAKGNRLPAPVPAASNIVSNDAQAVKAMLAVVAEAQKTILQGSDYVGERFADEARAIHLGESEARSIYGRATRAETESLLEEGIRVAPLPLPIVEPGQEN